MRRRTYGLLLTLLAGLFLARVAGQALVAFLDVSGCRRLLTMAWYPERRWLGTGTIPTAFHVVLAVYVLTLGHFYLRREAA